MSTEYVIEIESFESVKEAKVFAKKYIKSKHNKQINAVSRDFDVIELLEAPA